MVRKRHREGARRAQVALLLTAGALGLVAPGVAAPVGASPFEASRFKAQIPTSTTQAPTTSTTTTTAPPSVTTTTEDMATTSLPFATTIPPPVIIPEGPVNGSTPDPVGTPPPPPPVAPDANQPGPSGIPPGLALAIAFRQPAELRVSAAINELAASEAALAAATTELDTATAASTASQAEVDSLDEADRIAADHGADTRAELRRAAIAAYVSGTGRDGVSVVMGGGDMIDAQARLTYYRSINDDLSRVAEDWSRERRRLGKEGAELAERHGHALARVQLATTAHAAATARLEAARSELAQAGATAGVAPSLVPDIPDRVLDAYVRAAMLTAYSDPACRIRWWALAAIGRTESHHAGGRAIGVDGKISPAILGPVLDGNGPFALIADTDKGVSDGDVVYDRAVGPMQFIPATWRTLGVDASGDGVADPQNIYDAAYSSARYLCAAARPLPMDTEAGFRDAAYSYSHSSTYPEISWTGSAPYRVAAAAAEANR